MIYEKEKYERLIKETPLFYLDKEVEYAAYKRESYRMIEYLYCYLMAVNEEEYEPYGCEITEIATRCINNYDSSKGVFLHYFNSAWKQEFSHIRGDKALDKKFRGLKISEEDRRAVKKYVRLKREGGAVSTMEELYAGLSSAMDMPIEKVKEIVWLENIHVSGDRYIGDDGEELSMWDKISDDFVFDVRIEEKTAVEERLKLIESIFCGLQERQKPIIADLLTIKMCEQLDEFDGIYSFVSKEVMRVWRKTGNLPSQRTLAKKYKRDEASISRTYKNFLEKLRKEFLWD